MTDTTTAPLLVDDTGVLAPYVEAGIFREADIQVAGAIARAVPGTSDAVLLAAALCVRALQLGHVCVDLDRVATTVVARDVVEGSPPNPAADPSTSVEELPWPDPAEWAEGLRASEAVAVRDPSSGDTVDDLDPTVIRPLVFDGERVYLERYWRYERQVGDLLLAAGAASNDRAGQAGVLPDAIETRTSNGTPDADEGLAAMDAVLDRFFGPDDGDDPDLQRLGARVALDRRVTVLAGGPGTGKTHTVARMLAAAHQLALDAGRPIEVALAAPTGKAAARMTQAVQHAVAVADLPPDVAEPLLADEAVTIHRLLGYRDGISFRHDASNPLPHDLVVIDETSMVALPLMARLLDALRPGARLVLVGDPFQLASVEAGAVLGDVVGPAARATADVEGPLADNIVVLQRVHRFAADSAIADLADAVREGDADRALDVLRDPAASDVAWVEPHNSKALARLRATVTQNAVGVVEASRAGDQATALHLTSEVKVLAGTRFGPLGSHGWSDQVERRLPRLVEGLDTRRRWYIGRPVIITHNDYVNRVFNGDTGVVVDSAGRATVAMQGAEGLRTLLPSQLGAVETWWAMTIHKSQGSEFDHAIVSLPGAQSRVLTNELLYTGLTRAREQVTVVADEAALRTAIASPVARASGLGSRLWPAPSA